ATPSIPKPRTFIFIVLYPPQWWLNGLGHAYEIRAPLSALSISALAITAQPGRPIPSATPCLIHSALGQNHVIVKCPWARAVGVGAIAGERAEELGPGHGKSAKPDQMRIAQLA